MLCGDPRTIEKFPVYTQYQRGRQVFESSLATAFVYMHLASASLGLGSRWISATRNYYAQHLTKALLGIPKEMEIYDAMALGYPAAEPAPRMVRNRRDMVHYEYFDATASKDL
jgi:nitroreductase